MDSGPFYPAIPFFSVRALDGWRAQHRVLFWARARRKPRVDWGYCRACHGLHSLSTHRKMNGHYNARNDYCGGSHDYPLGLPLEIVGQASRQPRPSDTASA